MSNIASQLAELLRTDGAMCAAVVDSNSGMILGRAGSGLDLDLAAAGNTEVVRAKRRTIDTLGLKDAIEDILITLQRQYHIIRPLAHQPGTFLYLVLDRSKANLALARRACAESSARLQF